MTAVSSIKAGILSKQILLLAWPTILEQILQTVVQYADSAMVGQLGAQASAAVGVTTSAIWLISNLFLAAGVGVLAVISRAVGAGEKELVGKASVQAIYLAGFLGLAVGAVALLVSGSLPGWMGAEPSVQLEASRYFFIVSLPMLFRSAMIVFSAVLRATGDTRTPMVVNLMMNAVNIILNFFLIYETRPISILGISFTVWGAGLGVSGAAVATAIALTAGGVAMTLALLRSKRGRFPFRKIPETRQRGTAAVRPDCAAQRGGTHRCLFRTYGVCGPCGGPGYGTPGRSLHRHYRRAGFLYPRLRISGGCLHPRRTDPWGGG